MNPIDCGNCGYQNLAGAASCSRCGTTLTEIPPSLQISPIMKTILSPELSIGTQLRGKYIILKQLGKGGFGRTYLAEDTGRFHTKVVIKEFSPGTYNTNTRPTAENLFHREVQTLYKLQHHQIPKFWELFEAEKRLFLVQDFVEGKSYQKILSEKLSQNQKFNEVEIKQLFRQLLPVLSYIHSQGVIHRDISPDNIICREIDGIPVLIDFGGVKQVALNIVSEINNNNHNYSSPTSFGKIGFSPDEQWRGQVAPHSDLYALATTALCLMTGKLTPTVELRNPHTIEWLWEKQLNISPRLTDALDRMLEADPTKRFQSAQEVMEFLDVENLPVGSKLRDRYLVVEKLTQGGFGTIYLAEDTDKFHKKVVLKEFTPSTLGTTALHKAEELFHREAKTLNQLEHPQIPRFEGIFRDRKRLFLVQDFVDGQTCYQLRQKGKLFQESDIRKLFEQLLPVLSYIHSQGVIHRDISPENIILRKADGVPILIDFGTVKQIALNLANEVSSATTSSSSATVIGKVGYAPDEQMGKGIVGEHSDLYALAATALYLMTGKSPLDLWDGYRAEWLWQQELILSSEFTELLNRMLAKIPAQRFQSADEVLQFLETSTLESKKVTPTPFPSVVTLPPTPSKSGKKWFLGGLGIAAFVGAIAITFLTNKSTETKLEEIKIPAWGGDEILTVGLLTASWRPLEKYQGFTEYLTAEVSQKLGREVRVEIDAIEYQKEASEQVNQQMKQKKWDIAFTVSPMISVLAEDNNYIFAARMFPDTPQFESSLFVRIDSSIKSLADIKSETKIALGDFNSPVNFYMPIYDLYGKILAVDLGNKSEEIRGKVVSGEADIGVGVYSVLIRREMQQKFRIITRSRGIPLSGVYISPSLSKQEQNLVAKILLNAPENIKEDAAYGAGNQVDYQEFSKITKRVDEIINCVDWKRNPVRLFCDNSNLVGNSNSREPIIEGKVNGFTIVDSKTNYLTLQGNDGQAYRVVLPEKILEEYPKLSSVSELNLKTIQVVDVEPVATGSILELKITQRKQIKILE
ncbi:MAG: protein kinase [Microcoleaceae cyanobacterium]